LELYLHVCLILPFSNFVVLDVLFVFITNKWILDLILRLTYEARASYYRHISCHGFHSVILLRTTLSDRIGALVHWFYVWR
jgi:hypothetical protein